MASRAATLTFGWTLSAMRMKGFPWFPVVTLLGLALCAVFADAIAARDYPLIQGALLVFATSFALINLAVDVLYAVIDPRIRLQ